jgi:tRNA(Ile)-lysidine synthase
MLGVERLQAEVFAALDNYLKPSALLVGYSGGLDSRVLLELISRYVRQRSGFSLLALYVHHGLNIKADDWLMNCAQVCEALEVSFIAERVVIDKKNRQSLEDLARRARYNAFSQHLPEQGTLLTAHHQDDQLETLLLALKRGSGPRGLSAMPVQTSFASGHLFRPLLSFSRQQLLEWALSQQLSWIEDDSNFDERFDRNFLRQQVIPLLRQRWPEIAMTATRSAGLCAEQESLLDEIAQDDLAKSRYTDGSLQIAVLDSLSKPRRHQLFRFWLRQLTGTVPSQVQLEKIWSEVALARQDAIPELCWQAGIIQRYQQRLYFTASTPNVFSQANAKHIDSQPIDIGIPLQLSNGVLTLEADISSSLRLRMPNDAEFLTVEYGLPGSLKAHPAGRAHSRELKKLWQEYGVAPWLRSATPIICYQGKIAAVVGAFICREYLCRENEPGLRMDWQPI